MKILLILLVSLFISCSQKIEPDQMWVWEYTCDDPFNDSYGKLTSDTLVVIDVQYGHVQFMESGWIYSMPEEVFRIGRLIKEER